MSEKEKILEKFSLLKDRALGDVITIVERYLQDKAVLDREFNELDKGADDEIVSE